MAFPEGFLQDLKMRNDITDIVSSYVSLKRSGRNMVGLCPFHGEKTPSFNVYTENGSFYCFGCGVGGDVITFIMKAENLDYVDAVKFLAQRAGMDMPEDSFDDSMSKLRTRVFEANREAARFFYAALVSPAGRSGLDYFHSRALSDKTIRRFGLGFADEAWDSLCRHLRSKGFKDNEIVAANLGVKKQNGSGIYDRFRNRVMFPIMDLRGNVIAFGGRIMTDEKPKYLNTSDTPVFKKSANLYSLNNAKNSGSRAYILCEGYMDVIALNQAGFTNTVASLGTAFGEEQAMLLKRYASEVIVCYDSDAAGQKAAHRVIPILRKAGFTIKVLTVPNGKDPDEFIRSHGEDGPAAFKLVVEKSVSDVDYLLKSEKEQYDVNTSEGKIAYLDAAARIVSQIESPIEQEVYSSKICAELGIDKNAFVRQTGNISRRQRRELIKKEDKKIRADLSGRTDKINTDHYKKPRSSSAEEALVVYLLNNPDSEKQISSRVKPEQFQNALMRRYYEYIIAKIQSNCDPLNSITADFTGDEASKLYQMLARSIKGVSTEQALSEYINVINEESEKLSKEEVKEKTPEELNAYLERIRKKQQ